MVPPVQTMLGRGELRAWRRARGPPEREREPLSESEKGRLEAGERPRAAIGGELQRDQPPREEFRAFAEPHRPYQRRKIGAAGRIVPSDGTRFEAYRPALHEREIPAAASRTRTGALGGGDRTPFLLRSAAVFAAPLSTGGVLATTKAGGGLDRYVSVPVKAEDQVSPRCGGESLSEKEKGCQSRRHLLTENTMAAPSARFL